MRDHAPSSSPLLVFLPWLRLRRAVAVGPFRFRPWTAERRPAWCSAALHRRVRNMMSSHVGLDGVPMRACTIVTTAAGKWKHERRSSDDIWQAARFLALSTLSAQRFFVPFAEHVNAVAFRPIAQGIVKPVAGTSIEIRRRGTRLLSGGWTYGQIRFQEPISLHGTTPPTPNQRFAESLWRAWKKGADCMNPVVAALPLWLQANAEEQSLTVEDEIVFAGAAFEQLFDVGPGQKAPKLAGSLESLMSGFERIEIAQSKQRKVKPDPNFVSVQATWPLRKKWVKEHYEARNMRLHGPLRPGFSTNWRLEEHQVVAAFLFPLLVELLLKRDGYYRLSTDDVAACNSIDSLLDAAQWGQSLDPPAAPQWNVILRKAESRMAARRAISRAMNSVVRAARETGRA